MLWNKGAAVDYHAHRLKNVHTVDYLAAGISLQCLSWITA